MSGWLCNNDSQYGFNRNQGSLIIFQNFNDQFIIPYNHKSYGVDSSFRLL